LIRGLTRFSAVVVLVLSAAISHAAQLSTDARGAIPRDVQQLVVIDYRAMQNSPAAMNLRERVMPPELKQLEEALNNSGLNENRDVDQLAFALFRPSPGSDSLWTVGVAQGQFSVPDVLGNFRKNKIKPTMVRTNSVYPMTRTGMVLCFVDPSTMVFGQKDAVTRALDARDGGTPNLMTNNSLMDAMRSVDSNPLWSIMDSKGTQTMMKQILGEAGSVADFDTVKQRLQATWYSMSFTHGVDFNLTIQTGDSFTAATVSSLLTAAVMLRKMTSSDSEKQALSATSIGSDSGKLNVHFAESDSQFSALLQSPLFQSMVR
jgi:hypothetical protein